MQGRILTSAVSPFQFSPARPSHLSVGIIPIRSDGKMACHHYSQRSYAVVGQTFHDFVRIAHETIEAGESLEQSVHRGLQEELGLKANLVQYSGSNKCIFTGPFGEIEKTILYFLAHGISEVRRESSDSEATSNVVWYSPGELITILQGQRSMTIDAVFDESAAVQAAHELVETSGLRDVPG